jgi:metal-responsive CopG/Arc/MetJ family transcriptional regulator
MSITLLPWYSSFQLIQEKYQVTETVGIIVVVNINERGVKNGKLTNIEHKDETFAAIENLNHLNLFTKY